MTAADIARALGGGRSGAGWVARCPAHVDRTPSLAIACSPRLTALETEMFEALAGHAPNGRRIVWESAIAGLTDGPERDVARAFATGALVRRVRRAA